MSGRGNPVAVADKCVLHIVLRADYWLLNLSIGWRFGAVLTVTEH